ncbi:MAG: glycosyltransferase family 4 protein [Solirubrobacteraceae bacterium]
MVGRYYNRQGGVSAVIAELSDRAGAEHEIDVYTSEALDIDGSPARFVHVPMLQSPAWLQVPTFAAALHTRLDHSRYDIVHVHDEQGLGGDVITAHSCGAAWFDIARREAGATKALLSRVYPPHVSMIMWERLALHRSSAPIIAVSAKTGAELQQYLGIDPARIHVIYNGIDTCRFSPAPSRSQARAQLAEIVVPRREDAVVLLFVGYSFRRKGLARAIRALAAASDERLELWVAGGDDARPYRACARELGVAQRVRFLGHRRDVVGLMRAADAFVFPTSYDPFPLVLMEAIGCGTPVITSRAAGIAEVMTDGREGFLVDDPMDVGELERALGRFLDQQQRWPALNAAARKLALQWDWDSIWRRTEALYEDVLERKRARAGPGPRSTAALHGAPPTAAVLGAVRERPVPSAPARAGQRLLIKAGRLTYDDAWLRPLTQARRQALGVAAAGPPRLLVRVDEFPYSSGYDNPRFGYEASARFHAVMAQADVRHLMAIVPQWTHEPLRPDRSGGRPLDQRDRELLARMSADGVSFAQHGTTHRTRRTDPRRRSELCGLDDAALGALLDSGRSALATVGVHTRVLVAPFNRFDARQWPVLASRYRVVTGGPESVTLMGFHGGPQWRGNAIYLPCYAPLYARAADVLPAVESLIAAEVGTWVPIVLHMGWEIDDQFAALRRLATRIAPYAVSWEDFLGEVDASRRS